MILKPYPPAERPSLRLKICAAGALIGRRRDWGFQRKWEGNYLFLVSHIPSGVTRVGVTRDGNLRCHPIFLGKLTTFSLSLVIASESDDLLAVCRLLTTPIFPRRYSVFFLN